jgi:hypothetical protein
MMAILEVSRTRVWDPSFSCLLIPGPLIRSIGEADSRSTLTARVTRSGDRLFLERGFQPEKPHSKAQVGGSIGHFSRIINMCAGPIII